MTLLDRILERGVPIPTDPIIAARIERHLRRIKPDPLFRRRLRGRVLNRYVAAREGLLPAQPLARARTAGRRHMGVLGRGVLYASLLTAVGVSAVGAASQESLPGDAFYAVKLQLEEVRMRIAPVGLRDDLAAIAVSERLEEVEKLADSGRWGLVEEAAARVEQAERTLLELGGSGTDGAVRAAIEIQRHTQRLTELLATAPEAARHGLERAIQASSADEPPRPAEPNQHANQGGGANANGGQGPDGNNGQGPDGNNGQGPDGSNEKGHDANHGNGGGKPNHSPKPERTSHPEPTPDPAPTQVPDEPADDHGQGADDDDQGGDEQ